MTYSYRRNHHLVHPVVQIIQHVLPATTYVIAVSLRRVGPYGQILSTESKLKCDSLLPKMQNHIWHRMYSFVKDSLHESPWLIC